jgi:hypothetical protein
VFESSFFVFVGVLRVYLLLFPAVVSKTVFASAFPGTYPLTPSRSHFTKTKSYFDSFIDSFIDYTGCRVGCWPTPGTQPLGAQHHGMHHCGQAAHDTALHPAARPAHSRDRRVRGHLFCRPQNNRPRMTGQKPQRGRPHRHRAQARPVGLRSHAPRRKRRGCRER